MKARLIIILFALCFMGAIAQTPNEIQTRDVKVEKEGNNVNVSFRIMVSEKAVKPDYSITMIPVLFKDEQAIKLAPISVEGKRKALSDFRKVRSNREVSLVDPSAMRAANGDDLLYETTIPYESWMNESSLRLDKVEEGCCNLRVLPAEKMASNIVFERQIVPSIDKPIPTTAIASEVQKKWAFSKEDLIVDFRKAESRIEPELFDNRSTLKEIVEVLKNISANTTMSVNKIEITGFASPDGAYPVNVRLSGERAQALKDYLKENIAGLNDSDFILNSGKENWNGLKEMVESSNMEYKSDVLHLLNTVTPEQGLKQKLADLKWGVPYTYMYKEFFPKLRNACYIAVYYDTKGDKAADTINEAIAMIRNKNYNGALPKLLTVKDDPRAWNPIGICYMMMEDLSTAKNYLDRSAAQGNENAKANLKQIMQRK